jgi:hypothetical protein
MCAVLELTDRKKPLRQQCEKQQPVNLKKSERLYTHSKAREKLAAKGRKHFIKKFPCVLLNLASFQILPKIVCFVISEKYWRIF